MTVLLLLLNAVDAFGQKSYQAPKTSISQDLIGVSDFNKLSKLPEGFDAAADSYEFVGDNLVARGNAVVQSPGIEISADKIVVNLDSDLYDIEAAGNVSFSILTTTVRTMPIEQYEELLQDPRTRVTLLRYVVNDLGEQRAEVEIVVESSVIRAERAAGNLLTGVLQFSNFALKSGLFYCVGERAERFFDGTVKVHKARFTTCEYIQDDHDHYAIAAYDATIEPRDSNNSLFNYDNQLGDHRILMKNNFFQIYGVPVLWLPILYKPSDLSSFGGKIEFGSESDWGWYIRGAKHFKLMDEPYWNMNLMLDWYEKRGVGYGLTSDLLTPESATEFSFYGIYDRNPYEYWDRDLRPDDPEYLLNNSRLTIPHYRYEVRTNNMTHLTNRLDFRMQIDLISDYQYLRDYYPARFRSEYEPPTYASLEYQADRFTASAYMTLRINDFNSTVDRLPELRLDFQRQELFANIYYQGEMSLTPLFMRWRRFDRDAEDILRPNQLKSNRYKDLDKNWELRNYGTLRFDSLHMLYYPMKIWNINIIPRTGIRLTAYSASSEREIGEDELSSMFVADRIDGIPPFGLKVPNYDSKGGSKFRVIGELGVEVNTKFYHAWQDVKNAFWGLDGLRHVVVPYVNYTYIPRPTVNADNLYYFDEVDRITEQHFIRTGIVNRLQTRRNNATYEWLSLEHYWDFFIHDTEGFNHIGDFGTILKFRPTSNLTLSAELLLDAGINGDHNYEVTRGDKKAGRPGIDSRVINRLTTSIDYRFAPEWRIYANYTYSDYYLYRSAYSMGTQFSAMTATSMSYTPMTRSQTINGGFEFPLIFDKDLHGYTACTYDIDQNLVTKACVGITKRFHCWYVSAEGGTGQTWHRDRNGDYSQRLKNYLAVSVGLTAMPGLSFGQRVGVGGE
jgi:lipopolysaccharide assembly outer membrane protein LptD (OstA)